MIDYQSECKGWHELGSQAGFLYVWDNMPTRTEPISEEEIRQLTHDCLEEIESKGMPVISSDDYHSPVGEMIGRIRISGLRNDIREYIVRGVRFGVQDRVSAQNEYIKMNGSA